ncbi:hypothetical protein PL9214670273 [Planktothrix tepida PCC 9214]|uniref:HNH nuclease domain-containing protein n=1 Tax=Planktothrix tepida PCC 9214 TaxID=671072 RepID=A0A1J1LTB8_9CYAN|nr:hypothetical protein PL9214670273 [Planktothrix tepida PCC 9214]
MYSLWFVFHKYRHCRSWDTIKPTSLGGKDTYDNLQLLHKHCHDTKTAQDGSLTKNKVNPLEQVENYDINPF